MSRTIKSLVVLIFLLLPSAATAQVPLVVAGFAGVAFPTDASTPGETSGGFSFQTEVGLRLHRATFGAEFGQHKIGGDAKTRVFGGFARLPSIFGDGPVQLYLVASLGAYQFDPSAGKSSTTAGGSLGPGVTIRIRNAPVAFDVEARFHSTFDKLPRINNQQFISVLGGLELGF